jgi:hypothetical protein
MPGKTRFVLCSILSMLVCSSTAAANLKVQSAGQPCSAAAPLQSGIPGAAAGRIPGSQVAIGSGNIAWAWLGSPTERYDHDALGSVVHAGSLHALIRQASGELVPVSVQVPPSRVIEDRAPRLADLDGDGLDEIIVVESDLQLGSSIVVYGVQAGTAGRPPALVERARSPYLGTSHRWLNPVGVADFNGNGHLDIAAVTTPHLDGVLTLYSYRPPSLEPVAMMSGLSNHRIGTTEQQLSAIVHGPGKRTTVIIPARGLRTMHAVRMVDGKWRDVSSSVDLPKRALRITPLSSGACVLMANGLTAQLTLHE